MQEFECIDIEEEDDQDEMLAASREFYALSEELERKRYRRKRLHSLLVEKERVCDYEMIDVEDEALDAQQLRAQRHKLCLAEYETNEHILALRTQYLNTDFEHSNITHQLTKHVKETELATAKARQLRLLEKKRLLVLKLVKYNKEYDDNQVFIQEKEKEIPQMYRKRCLFEIPHTTLPRNYHPYFVRIPWDTGVFVIELWDYLLSEFVDRQSLFSLRLVSRVFAIMVHSLPPHRLGVAYVL